MPPRPELRILLAGALFSSGGAAIKYCALGPLHVAGLRAAIAAAVLLLLLPPSRRLSPRGLVLLPAFFGATFLFVWANKLTTAANAIFLQATAPFWVMLLGPLLLRERARPRDLLVLAGIAAGMALFFVAAEDGSATAPDPALGNLIALGSGLSYGLLLLGFRWLGRRDRGEQMAVVAWGNALTAAVALTLAGGLPRGSAADWAALLYLGVCQMGLPYLLLIGAIGRVPALQASLLLMVEPALNPLWAWLVHGEVPGPLPLLGGGLIVGAVALANVRSGIGHRPVPGPARD